jgi:hypothetical protein
MCPHGPHGASCTNCADLVHCHRNSVIRNWRYAERALNQRRYQAMRFAVLAGIGRPTTMFATLVEVRAAASSPIRAAANGISVEPSLTVQSWCTEGCRRS